MGSYEMKITRKHIEVEGLGKVYLTEFAYKPYYSGWDCDKINAKFHNRYIAPTERAWARSGETPLYIVHAYEGKFDADAAIYPAPAHIAFNDCYFDRTKPIGNIAFDANLNATFVPKVEITANAEYECMAMV